jgi:hypothetical protein
MEKDGTETAAGSSSAGMKRLIMAGLILWCGSRAAADKFWAQLTPEERAAAGLAQLTEQQQAALDILAERYARDGASHAVETARAKARAEGEAAAKAGLEQEIQKRDEARFGLTGPQAGPETIRSRIVGQFKGWSGRTLFHLDNGQTWVQADASDHYWVPAQAGPAVEVRKSSLGGWKLYVMPDERWVRVTRVN